MTEKQAHILNTALKLFAKEGIDAVTTKKIATEAKVSEGLIFKHFQNKNGLVESVLTEGHRWIQEKSQELGEIKSPKLRLRTMLMYPLNFQEEERHFWKLIYMLKWQRGEEFEDMETPVILFIKGCLEELGVRDVESTSGVIRSFLDGLNTRLLLSDTGNMRAVIDHFINQMNLNDE
jgi:AcrR family transcriptional regulator